MTPRMAAARQLVGRTIVAFNPNPARHQGVTIHNPEIVLDNGARLRFVTEERPDEPEYGTFVVYLPAPAAASSDLIGGTNR